MTDQKDLIERLREYGDDPQDVSDGEWAEWSHIAADALESQAARIAYLEAQLDGWQPIETAPDDESEIWVAGFRDGEWEYATATATQDTLYTYPVLHERNSSPYTHWMRPQPPKGGGLRQC